MANSRLKLTQTAVTRLIREHDGKKKERHWDTDGGPAGHLSCNRQL
ncbi:hypothetical protein ACQKH5_18525 [Hyphomonas sp. NPDC076900]